MIPGGEEKTLDSAVGETFTVPWLGCRAKDTVTVAGWLFWKGLAGKHHGRGYWHCMIGILRRSSDEMKMTHPSTFRAPNLLTWTCCIDTRAATLAETMYLGSLGIY